MKQIAFIYRGYSTITINLLPLPSTYLYALIHFIYWQIHWHIFRFLLLTFKPSSISTMKLLSPFLPLYS